MSVIRSLFFVVCLAEASWNREESVPEDGGTSVTGSEGNQLRLFMCITGQLGRLVLDSKIENFIKAQKSKGHVVDVVTILDPALEPRYYHAEASGYGNRSTAFNNLQEVEAALAPHARNSRVVTYLQPENPKVPSWYVANSASHSAPRQRETRSKMQMRQFYTIAQCYNHMEDFEAENGERYDEVLRLREDAYIMRPPTLLHEMNPVPDALAIDCDRWMGINDKALLIRREAASVYYKGLLEAVTHPELMHHLVDVKNPEMLTLKVLQHAKLTIVQDFDKLPVVILRRQFYEGVESCIEMCSRFQQCWDSKQIDWESSPPRCPRRGKLC